MKQCQPDSRAKNKTDRLPNPFSSECHNNSLLMTSDSAKFGYEWVSAVGERYRDENSNRGMLCLHSHIICFTWHALKNPPSYKSTS